jgi:hypothetical protein
MWCCAAWRSLKLEDAIYTSCPDMLNVRLIAHRKCCKKDTLCSLSDTFPVVTTERLLYTDKFFLLQSCLLVVYITFHTWTGLPVKRTPYSLTAIWKAICIRKVLQSLNVIKVSLGLCRSQGKCWICAQIPCFFAHFCWTALPTLWTFRHNVAPWNTEFSYVLKHLFLQHTWILPIPSPYLLHFSKPYFASKLPLPQERGGGFGNPQSSKFSVTFPCNDVESHTTNSLLLSHLLLILLFFFLSMSLQRLNKYVYKRRPPRNSSSLLSNW